MQTTDPVTETRLDIGEWGSSAAHFDEDLPLVDATKNGDTSAFEQLVKRYDRRLLRIAQNVTHDPDAVQDVVQDAFLKAYQKLDQFVFVLRDIEELSINDAAEALRLNVDAVKARLFRARLQLRDKLSKRFAIHDKRSGFSNPGLSSTSEDGA